MKKKGLILIPFLTGYGGTETVIHNLLSEYNKEKYKYDINLKLYSLGGFINGDWLQFPNVKIFKFPKERYIREFLYLFLLPFLILYSIIKEKPNFIISTNPVMWTIIKLCSRVLHKNIKVIAWYHYSYMLKPVNHYCLIKPDNFLAISTLGKRELIDLGISSSRIFIVNNPIKPTNHIIRSSKNHNKFIYVGRLEYNGKKNVKELFEALGLIKSESWILYIYGTGPDEYKLKQLSSKLGISKKIRWMGFVSNPLDHIRSADALLLTSTSEGFSMVIGEALSCGLYVISSNCPVGPKQLINSYSGDLYHPGDIKQLAYYINNIIKNGNISNPYELKNSVNKFYVKNYYKNFINCLNKIDRK